MLKGNDKLLDLNLNNNIRSSKARKILYEALYELFLLILQSLIENILFEIVTFLLSYLQIIMFIFNETVRQLIIKF